MSERYSIEVERNRTWRGLTDTYILCNLQGYQTYSHIARKMVDYCYEFRTVLGSFSSRESAEEYLKNLLSKPETSYYDTKGNRI